MLKLILGLLIPSFIIISILLIYIYKKTTSPPKPPPNLTSKHLQIVTNNHNNDDEEELVCFQGGEDLTIPDILDAPGEVIGKSTYGTLYKANLTKDESSLLLRFLRPACSSGHLGEFCHVLGGIGLIRHPNLVPLLGFYVGCRGEKLLVYPFFGVGNLAQFIKDGNSDSHKWDVIYNITLGIVKGLAYLHSGLHKPMIHSNLKSKNILLTPDFQPYISDYGLHLLLNPTSGQEMLETSSQHGYKPPELMKVKDSCESTDIYSLGIVLLELLTGKEAVNGNSENFEDVYLPNVIRKAILDHRIKDMYHPDILLNLTGKNRNRIEDRVLKLVQLAMSCCSPSPNLRPLANEVVRKVEEIGQELQHRKT